MGQGTINSPELYESSNFPEIEKDRLRVSEKKLVIGKDFDVIDITYPTNTTEVFAYSLNTDPVITVQLTYASASKNDLVKVEVL